MFAMASKHKRLSYILSVLLTLAAPLALQPVSAQDAVSRAEIKTAARMRAGPSEDEAILARLFRGEVVQLLLQEGGWSKIRRIKGALLDN